LNSSAAGNLNRVIGKLERRYDIDWLRIFATVTIFFFHSARIFDYDWWHIKNNQLSFGMTLFVTFVVQWIMPLFFMLSGESAHFSLNFRKSGQFVRERFQRLLIPFVFGVFVLAPPQIYFERVSNAQFSGSFIQFYPHYFNGVYGFGGNFAWMGLQLWYLLFLFLFSLITLPVFLYLKKASHNSVPPKMAGFFRRPGAIFLLAVPLALALALTNPLFQPDGLLSEWSSLVYFGGWNLFVYIIFFVYGYLLASDQFRLTLGKHGKIAFIMGIILSIPVFLPQITSGVSLFDYPFGYVLSSFLGAFYSWFWVIAILGLGSMHLSFNNRWLRGANEATLPFYILHQTVIVAIGFYVISLDLSVMVKYLLICASSLAAVTVLVLSIRQVNLLRLLFGMRLRKEHS